MQPLAANLPGVASTLAPYVERAAGDLTAAGAVDLSGCLVCDVFVGACWCLVSHHPC